MTPEEKAQEFDRLSDLLNELVSLISQLRAAQKRFFYSRREHDLQAAKALERQVDDFLALYESRHQMALDI